MTRTIEQTLALSGLDETCQTAALAMSEAHDAKKWAECVAVGDAWLEARGEMPAICAIWYAQSLMGVKRLDEALRWSKLAVDSVPEHETMGKAAALGGYAQALGSIGEFTKARRVLKEFVDVPSDDPEAIEKQGQIVLAISDKWKQGWAMHEKRMGSSKQLPPNCRQWDGKTKERVAVLHEQGIGDAVLAMRWLRWVKETTGHAPLWYGPGLIHSWIEPELAEVGSIDHASQEPQSICAVYSLSLPALAGVRWPSDVPKPYAPESIRALRANRRRTSGDLVRVGVCWKGADWGWHNFERSFSPEEFAPIVQPIEGVEFSNFCHAADVPESWPFQKREFADIADTGRALCDMDLVVSVDTAVVHIAGSLGIPTLAILPTKPDWRYEWPGGYKTPGGSPFYSSVTTIRRRGSDDLTCLEKVRFMVEKYAERVQKMEAR